MQSTLKPDELHQQKLDSIASKALGILTKDLEKCVIAYWVFALWRPM